eukprot:COSAG06_NODE_155_length_21876_cov_22.287643_4_plen_78_part_00
MKAWPQHVANRRAASFCDFDCLSAHVRAHFAYACLLSQVKRPPGSTLPGHYEGNKGAFHDFIMWPAGGSKLTKSGAH